MLNPDFTFALEEFTNLESHIQFYAPVDIVSSALNDGYMKWVINGIGEAYGYWFKLKSNQQPFIVKTMVNVNELVGIEPVEWTIDTKNLSSAQEVFRGLKLDPKVITWEKEN